MFASLVPSTEAQELTKEIEYNELDGSIHELPEFHPSPDRYILLAMMVAAGVLSGLVSGA